MFDKILIINIFGSEITICISKNLKYGTSKGYWCCATHFKIWLVISCMLYDTPVQFTLSSPLFLACFAINPYNLHCLPTLFLACFVIHQYNLHCLSTLFLACFVIHQYNLHCLPTLHILPGIRQNFTFYAMHKSVRTYQSKWNQIPQLN